MSSSAPFFMDRPSFCSCTLPGGHRGTGGWHLREIKSPHSTTRHFEAYERCPAYWAKLGYKIDPRDRRLLMVKEETKETRRVKA